MVTHHRNRHCAISICSNVNARSSAAVDSRCRDCAQVVCAGMIVSNKRGKGEHLHLLYRHRDVAKVCRRQSSELLLPDAQGRVPRVHILHHCR